MPEPRDQPFIVVSESQLQVVVVRGLNFGVISLHLNPFLGCAAWGVDVVQQAEELVVGDRSLELLKLIPIRRTAQRSERIGVGRNRQGEAA